MINSRPSFQQPHRSNRIEIPDPNVFHDNLSRYQNVADIAKLIQRSVFNFTRDLNSIYNIQLTLDGNPGFSRTSCGINRQYPLPDKCTIVLLQGSFRLHDEMRTLRETYVGLEAEGSKTLMANSNTITARFHSVCCWDFSECPLARKGKCRSKLGVVIPRDPKNPMWWERDDERPNKCAIL